MKKIVLITLVMFAFKFNSIAKFKMPTLSIECSFSCGHASCGLTETCWTGTVIFPCHIPCINYGSLCSWKISLGMAATGTTFNENEPNTGNSYDCKMQFITIPYNIVTFSMPARSIYLPEYEMYVNIPQQNRNFQTTNGNDSYIIVNGVTFTEQQLYNNE